MNTFSLLVQFYESQFSELEERREKNETILQTELKQILQVLGKILEDQFLADLWEKAERLKPLKRESVNENVHATLTFLPPIDGGINSLQSPKRTRLALEIKHH